MYGVNLSGAEFGAVPGMYGMNYIYPSSTDLAYYADKGVDFVRLPFRWERIQSTLDGELDQAELGRLKTFMADADANGLKVVLDLHNYGGYGSDKLGSDGLPISSFQDLWGRLATELKNFPSLMGYGLMNEPNNFPDPTIWPQAAQAAIDSIRAVDPGTAIYVAGDGWGNAQNWQSVNDGLKNLIDPANNLIFEAHQYFDYNNSGTYQGSYEAEQAYPEIGVERLQSFITWLSDNNLKGFIGEYAVPENDPRWTVVMEKFLAELAAHDIPSAIWGGGPWWGDYPLSVEPNNGVDSPQMDVLERFIRGDQLMEGTAAGETLDGGKGNDTIHGNGGNDILIGGDGDDIITGGDGDDVMSGGAGNDYMDGGLGKDTVSYADAAAAVKVDLGLTTAQNTGGAGIDTILDVSAIIGSAYGDMLTGSSKADTISGGAGDDILKGGKGNDYLYGNDGNDILEGGADTDKMIGGAGIDTASYALATSAVTVSLMITKGQATGGAGTDTIIEVENLTGSAFNDTLSGNNDNNVIEGGAGNDMINGNGGSDTASYVHALSAVTVSLLLAGVQQNTLAAGLDTLIAMENLTGSSFNDLLTGDAGTNILQGGAGNDMLDGGAGIDTASYANAEVGVTVNLAVDSAQDTVGAGVDTLLHIENLTGSAFNDKLTGDSGANTLQGGAGNDILDGGAGIDTASYADAVSGVTVGLGVPGQQNTLSAGLDTLIAVENLTGSAFNDLLTGDAGTNVIDGGAGNDLIEGGTGQDWLVGGAGIDTVIYAHALSGVTVGLGNAAAQDTIGSGIHTLSGFENLTGSAFNDKLTGDAGANILRGGDGGDALSGMDGNDILYGGAGADSLTGGAGADRFVFEVNGGADKVKDFSLAQHDVLDLHGMLTGYDPLTSAITDFIQITTKGSASILSVDMDGGGNYFVAVATLEGITGLTDEAALLASGALQVT